MSLCLTKDNLLESHGKNMRLMGIDAGEKTLGLALSDTRLMIASPLETIQRTKWSQDAEALFEIMDKHQVFGLVIGLPKNMDGSEGPRCQSTRQLANNILKLRDVPLIFWDERLSTAAVTRTLLDADMSRKRRAEVVDKMAASYILQGFLDSR